MATAIGDLLVRIGADITGFENETRKATRSLQTIGDRLQTTGAALSLSITAPLAAAGFAAIKTAGQAEQTAIAFETMLGSAEKAGKFLGQLEEFAATTPFEFPGLLEAAKRMQALGFEAEDVIPTMRIVGDTVAGLGGGEEAINRITLALGQMQAKGKVSAEEMNQLAEVGIPAWELLAEAIGTGIPEAMKMAETGAIRAAEALPAILEGMGDRFGGLMEKQSKTLLGTISNLQDQLFFIVRDLGEPLADIAGDVIRNFVSPMVDGIKRLVDGFLTLPEPVQKIGIALTGLVAAIGPLTLALGFLISNMPMLVSGFAALTGPIGLTVAAVAGVTTAVVVFSDEITAALTAVGDFASGLGLSLDPIRNMGKTINDQVIEPLQDLSDFLKSFSGVKSVFSGMRRNLERQIIKPLQDITARGRQARLVEDLGRSMSDLGTKMRDSSRNAAMLGSASDILGVSLEGVEAAAGEAKQKLQEFADTRSAAALAQDLAVRMENLAAAIEEGTEETIDLTVAVPQLETRLGGLSNEMVAVLTNTARLSDGISELSEEFSRVALPDLGGAINQTGALATSTDALTPSVAAASAAVKALGQTADETSETILTQVSTAVTDLGKDLANIVVEGGSAADAMDAFKKAILRIVAENAMGLLLGQLGSLVKMLPGLGKIKDVLGGIFNVGGGAASAAGGIGGAAGGAGGLLGGLAGGNPIAGLAQLGATIVGLFQGARREDTLNAIEESTRRASLFLGGRADQGVLGVLFDHSDFLQDIRGQLNFVNDSLDTIKGVLGEINGKLASGILIANADDIGEAAGQAASEAVSDVAEAVREVEGRSTAGGRTVAGALEIIRELAKRREREQRFTGNRIVDSIRIIRELAARQEEAARATGNRIVDSLRIIRELARRREEEREERRGPTGNRIVDAINIMRELAARVSRSQEALARRLAEQAGDTTFGGGVPRALEQIGEGEDDRRRMPTPGNRLAGGIIGGTLRIIRELERRQEEQQKKQNKEEKEQTGALDRVVRGTQDICRCIEDTQRATGRLAFLGAGVGVGLVDGELAEGVAVGTGEALRPFLERTNESLLDIIARQNTQIAAAEDKIDLMKTGHGILTSANELQVATNERLGMISGQLAANRAALQEIAERPVEVTVNIDADRLTREVSRSQSGRALRTGIAPRPRT